MNHLFQFFHLGFWLIFILLCFLIISDAKLIIITKNHFSFFNINLSMKQIENKRIQKGTNTYKIRTKKNKSIQLSEVVK